MSLLCGMDFSEASRGSARVAAGMAVRLGVPLYLVHALSDWPEDERSAAPGTFLSATRRALDQEVAQLRSSSAEVNASVETGSPMDFLVRAADRHTARFIVIGATGRGDGRSTGVGSHADRLVQQAQVPVLVVRGSEPFLGWFTGDRPLRVLVGLSFDATSDEAWRWARSLETIGPIDLVGAHVYWLPHELRRLGLTGERSGMDPDTEVEALLQEELQDRFQGGGARLPHLRVQPSIGRTSDHLLRIATEERVDLIVVGSHGRHLIERLWEGSTSRGVLHGARASIACVPARGRSASHKTGRHRVAVVATDLSQAGDCAIEHAYAAVGAGGIVHLVHVLDSARPVEARTGENVREDAARHLMRRVPRSELAEHRATEVHVIESARVAEAIVQAAERLGADLICIGIRDGRGMSNRVTGVVEELVAATRRPILLTRPPPG